MNDKYCESKAEPGETERTHQSVITQHRQRYFSLKRRSAEQRQECFVPVHSAAMHCESQISVDSQRLSNTCLPVVFRTRPEQARFWRVPNSLFVIILLNVNMIWQVRSSVKLIVTELRNHTRIWSSWSSVSKVYFFSLWNFPFISMQFTVSCYAIFVMITNKDNYDYDGWTQ